MKTLSLMEMRTIDGGASKYVTCPICGQRVKTSILTRLFRSNSTARGSLTADHGLLKNYGKRITHKTV